VFYLDSQHVYRVTELDALPWLMHGFGTRHSDVPEMFRNLATLKQIHSASCVEACGRGGELGQGDALLENTPAAVIAVKTADCVPILLVDERRRAVAAVHAGWRGTVARIAATAVAAMHEKFGTEPRDLHAAIGPAIGVCCYEVGPEVAEQFRLHGRAHLDLRAADREQLLEVGVTPERIYASNLCTKCLAAEFHSYRRDGQKAGRLYSFVGLQAVE
jgi:YfiH family protein